MHWESNRLHVIIVGQVWSSFAPISRAHSCTKTTGDDDDGSSYLYSVLKHVWSLQLCLCETVTLIPRQARHHHLVAKWSDGTDCCVIYQLYLFPSNHNWSTNVIRWLCFFVNSSGSRTFWWFSDDAANRSYVFNSSFSPSLWCNDR